MSLKASDTIRRYGMFDGVKAVVAGVSGGADSMTLLHFLCAVKNEFGITVFAAHVNHGLRGAEADRDEQFVKDACRRLGVELFTLHADVRAETGKTGESEEQAGRRVRYEFFARLCEEHGAVAATAHTLSDAIETLLFNIARGTGLRGLCGIPPKRDGVIRPLIRDTRADIEAYCRENRIGFVTDSTNFCRDYARNRLRLDAAPVLYRVNPSFGRAAARLFDNLAEDEALLSQMAQSLLEKARAGENEYDAAILRTAEPALRTRAVAEAARLCSGTDQEARHIRAVCAILGKNAGRLQIRGCFAEIFRGKLRFFRVFPDEGKNFVFPLAEGVYKNRYYDIIIKSVDGDEIAARLKKINKLYLKNALDCDKIIGSADVGGRRDGDFFRPAGRGVSKTLKKLYNEAGVGREKRAFLPCARDEKGILWVGGFGADERCAARAGTKRAFLLSVAERPPEK